MYRLLNRWVVFFATGCFSSVILASTHYPVPSGKVSLRDNLNISWSVNLTKKTIKLTIRAGVDFKDGWILVGFMPKKDHAKPAKLVDTRGDVFVLWTAYKRRNHWQVTNCNTMVNNGTLAKDHSTKSTLYHLSRPLRYANKTLTAIVWRNQDSHNKEDLPLTSHDPVYLFALLGTHDPKKNKKWTKFLKEIEPNLDDGFASVVLFDQTHPDHHGAGKKDLGTYLTTIAKQHWVGILVGAAACLTVIITCIVYCCSKRHTNSEFRKKKVTVSFYKEDDYDDEAAVSFLQSEET